MRWRLGYLPFLLLAFSVPLKAQIEPIPTLKVQPIPLPGGDIFPPYGLYNQFFPGPLNQNPPFDPMNADPQGITNFHGVTAMGYTSGFTSDQKFAVVTDSTSGHMTPVRGHSFNKFMTSVLIRRQTVFSGSSKFRIARCKSAPTAIL
jgi:hypothetical protein